MKISLKMCKKYRSIPMLNLAKLNNDASVEGIKLQEKGRIVHRSGLNNEYNKN